MTIVRRVITASSCAMVLAAVACTLPVAPDTDSASTAATAGGSASSSAAGAGVPDDCGACQADLAQYCAGLFDATGKAAASWQAWCNAQPFANNGRGCGSHKYAIVNCLAYYADRITPACKASQDRRQQANEAMLTDCTADKKKYCSNTTPVPGSTPLEDCLKAHYSDLQSACRASLDYHESLICS